MVTDIDIREAYYPEVHVPRIQIGTMVNVLDSNKRPAARGRIIGWHWDGNAMRYDLTANFGGVRWAWDYELEVVEP